MEDQSSNPLLCDIETGMCQMPDAPQEIQENKIKAGPKPVRVIYFTDPICSSCWGIEPQLRKLKLEYGNSFEMEYRMGGLLPDWGYNSGGISKPSDVAHHWDEVSHHYDMPIDGDVWLEDPLHSSYPPSIAFKAAALQDKSKAAAFLRAIREMVFLRKKNIARWEHLVRAAQQVGLNVKQFQLDYEGKAKELFNEDLALARELGVRGFPTLFFVDSLGKQERVYGTKPYGVYETALLKLQPDANKTSYDASWNNLFAKYPTLTSREFAELVGIGRNDSDKHLEQIHKEGHLQKTETKNGMLWMRKNSSR